MQWFLHTSAAMQAFLLSLFMYSMTALGAACVFFSGKGNKKALALLNGGAAGIMIAASFFSLLLPAIGYETALPSSFTVTFGFLLGGAFILLSDVVFSRSGKLFRRFGDGKCALLYFAVTLHNIPEGMAVGVAFAQGAGAEGAVLAAALLGFGIAIQNFPEGMCVAFPLRAKGMSRCKSFLFSQGSGLVEIPACVLGAALASVIVGLMPWALSFSAGAMIAVVCSELLPECVGENKPLALLGTIAGFCIMTFLDIALG